MSRLSSVRDAIANELRSSLMEWNNHDISGDKEFVWQLPIPVDACVIPNYPREVLAQGPRVIVRSGSREITVDQGPDDRRVTVEVGVVGLVSPSRGDSDVSNLRISEDVKLIDRYDGLLESIIALWSPNGPLAYTEMAEHRFVSVTQETAFDARQLYEAGTWLSIITLTYFDYEDE